MGHRDLAARNILLGDNFTAKVADFGLSRFAKDQEVNKTKSDVGPIKWMAPEAIKDKIFSEKTDVWSYGVTLWEVQSRSNPYPQKDLVEVATSVCYKGLKPDIPAGTQPLFVAVFNIIFMRKPAERPTMRQIGMILEGQPVADVMAKPQLPPPSM